MWLQFTAYLTYSWNRHSASLECGGGGGELGCSSPAEELARDGAALAVLPRVLGGGVHVRLDALGVAGQAELGGGGVRAGDVGVVWVDEYALWLRARAWPGRAWGRVGGFERIGLLGRAQEGLLHVRVLGAGRRLGSRFRSVVMTG